MTRRTFLAAPVVAAAAASPDNDDELRRLISDADLVYTKPVPRSEEGMPVGNGRMGTLVWTTPESLRMQINRVDVYANNSYTNSFFERHNDYCGGCGFVDIDFGRELFPESGFPQTLSVYDGLLTGRGRENPRLAGAGRDSESTCRCMLKSACVCCARRTSTTAANWRTWCAITWSPCGRATTRRHRAWRFAASASCSRRNSARATISASRQWPSARARGGSSTRPSCACEVQAGTVLIASAATFDPKEDVAAAGAATNWKPRSPKGPGRLAKETADWWHEFWSRGWVSLHSADGVARNIAANYHYFLYLMAATSRGKFPPKFNGMLWNTGGDLRTWGAQHWYANTSCYYEAIFASNRMELLDPFFDMYSGMFDASATAARQQWGSQGIYIAETSYFNGLEKLPDEIAAEMQDLYLLRKPWEQRSERFKEFAATKHPHSSRWNWIQAGEWKNGRYAITERGFGPYGAVNHIFGSTAKIAYLLLAALRIHAGCRLAAHARLPHAERRGRVLSQLPERKKRRGRQVSHPQRQQQRERLRGARYR